MEEKFRSLTKDALVKLINSGEEDLFNADLSNADLSNANLSNANLFNADLSNADLFNADLFNANLFNAKNCIYISYPKYKYILIEKWNNNIIKIKTPIFWGTINEFKTSQPTLITLVDSLIELGY